MKTQRLYLCMLIFRFLPETRLFKLKSLLLRWAGAKIGTNVRCCSSATILGPGYLAIDDNAWIGHQVLICPVSQLTIGKSVDIGPRVYIGTGTHEINPNSTHSAGPGVNKDVVIHDGVWLGVGSVILPGVTIGAKSVVAAGAVVTENVQPGVVVGGIPARVIRNL